MLGMAYSIVPEPIRPDYSKSLDGLFWDVLLVCEIPDRAVDLSLLLYELVGLDLNLSWSHVRSTDHPLDHIEDRKQQDSGYLRVGIRAGFKILGVRESLVIETEAGQQIAIDVQLQDPAGT
jgi:hypothetical protein